MRTRAVFRASILAAVLAGCAGSPEGPLEPNRMRLTAMEVVDPKVDVRYPAFLRYEARGDVRIIRSCFTWFAADSSSDWLDDWTGLGNGPYCLVPEGEARPGAVTTMLVSGYPGTYRLAVYVRYESAGETRTTNTLSEEIVVMRRLPWPANAD